MKTEASKPARDIAVGDEIYHAENGWEAVVKVECRWDFVYIWTTSPFDGPCDLRTTRNDQVAVRVSA